VNDAPVAGNDAYSVNEDAVLTIAAPSGVLANDSDIDSASLTAALVSGPAHGVLSLNTNGGFTYTPAANFNGADSFTYKANDGSLDSNLATVSLTINPVNDAPVAGNDAYSTNEDVPLIVVPASGVLANDSDIDSASLTAILVTNPTHGALSLNANAASPTPRPPTSTAATASLTRPTTAAGQQYRHGQPHHHSGERRPRSQAMTPTR